MSSVKQTYDSESAAYWRTDWRTGKKVPAKRYVRGGLENRFGPLGPTRVQIPPPPLYQAGLDSRPARFLRAAVSVTFPVQSTGVHGCSWKSIVDVLTGAPVAHNWRTTAPRFHPGRLSMLRTLARLH